MRRRWPCITAGAALTVLALGSGWNSAQAQGEPKLGSYTLAATAPGFEMYDTATPAVMQAPYTTAALKGGGTGFALASVAWPGDIGANADKVVLLLFPHKLAVGAPGSAPVTYVGIPDAITGPAEDNAHLADYPIRAEATSGTSQPDSTFDGQGATLTAHADPALAQATATMKGAEAPNTFSFGNSNGVSNVTLSGSTGVASATSHITDIDFGGVIKIKSVTSTADGTTNGVTASATGSTVIEGMTIADQPAYVDDQGVHMGAPGEQQNAAASDLANKALNGAGFTFSVAQPDAHQDGATANYTAGSLIIHQHLPNPQAPTFTYALGGSRVSVTATPGRDFVPPPLTTPLIGSRSSATPSSPTRVLGITSTPLTSKSAGIPLKPTSSSPISGTPIAAAFEGLGGQVVLGLLGSGLMFFGFRRVADDIVDRAPSSCPLETT